MPEQRCVAPQIHTSSVVYCWKTYVLHCDDFPPGSVLWIRKGDVVTIARDTMQQVTFCSHNDSCAQVILHHNFAEVFTAEKPHKPYILTLQLPEHSCFHKIICNCDIHVLQEVFKQSALALLCSHCLIHLVILGTLMKNSVSLMIYSFMAPFLKIFSYMNHPLCSEGCMPYST